MDPLAVPDREHPGYTTYRYRSKLYNRKLDNEYNDVRPYMVNFCDPSTMLADSAMVGFCSHFVSVLSPRVHGVSGALARFWLSAVPARHVHELSGACTVSAQAGTVT